MERAQLSEVSRTRHDELLLLVWVLHLVGHHHEKKSVFFNKKEKTKEIYHFNILLRTLLIPNKFVGL